MKGYNRCMFDRLSLAALLIFSLCSSETMAIQEDGVFFGTPEFDRANSIVLDGSDGYYVVGASSTQAGSSGWIHLYRNDQSDETSLNLSIQQPSYFISTLLFDVLLLPEGDLIAVGSGLPKDQAALPESQQREDGWVIRVTPDGQTIWSQRFAVERHERFYFVIARPDGTILVGGRSETSKNIGSSKGVSYVIDPETGKLLHRNIWGDERIRRAGFYDGVSLPDGGYILVGWATKTGSEKDDVWIVRSTPRHVEHWSKTWGGVDNDLGYSAILDDNGTIMIFGWGTQKQHTYTSGLAMRLDQSGHILNTVFLNAGDSGDDKFLSGIQLQNGEYVVVGEASLSLEKYRGKAWAVKLDADLSKIGEKYFQIRGSRFLGLVANTDSAVIGVGFGIRPDRKQVDAWITKIYRANKIDSEKQMASPVSIRQGNVQIAKETFEEGTRLGKKGAYRDAIHAYSRAIELNPGYIDAHLYRALTNLQLGNFTNAIDDLNKIIVLDPSADHYRTRADVYARNDHLDKAIIDYNRLLELDPSSADGYSNRATAYGEKGDYEKAIRDSTKAILLDPGNPMYRFARGILKAKQGNYDDAMIDAMACERLSGGTLDLLPGEGRVVDEVTFKCTRLIADLMKAGAKLSD